MIKYLVCESQSVPGCDYTIGCGYRWRFLFADSVEDAVEKVVYPDGRDEYCALEGENALDEILIVEASPVFVVDVNAIKQEIKERKDRQAKAAQTERELAELQRLRAKYDAF